MVSLDTILEFDWDSGNIDKSLFKHNIPPNEAEEVFYDRDSTVKKDVPHSQSEDRYIIIGKTQKDTILLVIFTFRKKKVRIISARIANNKERSLYEKT